VDQVLPFGRAVEDEENGLPRADGSIDPVNYSPAGWDAESVEIFATTAVFAGGRFHVADDFCDAGEVATVVDERPVRHGYGADDVRRRRLARSVVGCDA